MRKTQNLSKNLSAVALFLLLQIPYIVSANSPNCAGAFQLDSLWIREAQQFQRAWSQTQFTDPRNHDQRNFRYLLHGVRQRPELSLEQSLLAKARIITTPSPDFDMILSASVISSQSRSQTWTQHGFILDVPPENILAPREHDLGLWNKWEKGLLIEDASNSQIDFETYKENIFRQYGIKSPQELERLENSASIKFLPTMGRYNEIAVDLSGSSGRNPRIKGLFILDDGSSDFLQSNTYLEMKSFADAQGLPLIVLQVQSVLGQ